MARLTPRQPDITVVMAARDAEAHVARALESVLNQSLETIELVVAVWGSSDRTADVCARTAERDIRVEVLEDAGATRLEAWARGVAAARGSYVLFADAEDWLMPGVLEQLHIQALNRNADLLFCGLSAEVAGGNADTPAEDRYVSGMRAVRAAEARTQAWRLVTAGLLWGAEAHLVRRTTALAALGALADASDEEGGGSAPCTEVALLVRCLERAERVGAFEFAQYKLTVRGRANRFFSVAENGAQAARCAVRARTSAVETLWDAFKRWGIAEEPAAAAALQLCFLRALVGCVQAVCDRSCSLSTEEKRASIAMMVESPAAQGIMGAFAPRDLMRRYVARAVLKGDVNLCYLEGCLMSVVGADRLFPLQCA